MTTRAEADLLLKLAREAIVARVGTTAPTHAAWSEAADFDGRRGGVFVTLHARGELRGCIGHIESDGPIAETVARCAAAAAFDDPRFPAVTAAEIPDLEIELSLLGPLVPINGP